MTPYAFDVSALSVDAGGKRLLTVPRLQLPAGHLTALIGANGAGKSTLLRALAGFHGQGAVLCHGQPLAAHGRQFAWVGQHEAFDNPLTVADYVALGLRPRLGWLGQARASDRADVARALQRMEIAPLARARLSTLSGGERQRAAIARALVQDTPVLLLDEPCNHLDIRHQQLLMRTLHALCREGRSVVTVLHDLTLAANYADTLVLMQDGRVTATGTPDTVLHPATLADAYRWTIHPTRHDSGAWHFDTLGGFARG